MVMDHSQPCIRWNLQLSPPSLQNAYVQEHWRTRRRSDYQDACYLLIALAVLSLSFDPHRLGESAAAAAPAWVAGVVWLVLLQFPAFYNRHRVLVLCAVRLVVGFACLHATSSSGGGTIDSSSGILASTQSSAGGQRQQPFEGYEWPALMLLVQLLLASNTAHVAVEAARLPLPWLAQCMLVACKPIITLLNHRALPGLIAHWNTPHTLAALSGMLSRWATLVQSGQAMHVPDSPLLQGRSCTVLLAVTQLYITTLLVTCYACYIATWAHGVFWLLGKAKGCADAAGVAADRGGREPQGLRLNGDVVLTHLQLQDACLTPAAALLLSKSGFVGTLKWLCFHACALNTLCLVAVVFSRRLVQQLLPGLLTQNVLDIFYPLSFPVAA